MINTVTLWVCDDCNTISSDTHSPKCLGCEGVMSAVDFIRQPLAQTLSNKEDMNKVYSATIENGKLMCNGFALQSAANEANNEHGQKEGISWAEAVAQGRTIHVSKRGQAALDSIPGKITPAELDETPIEDLIGESTLIKLVEGERDQKPLTRERK